MTALQTHDVPDEIDPSEWSLRVTGAVSHPLHIEQTELSQYPAETVSEDFECVQGWVAEGLSWRGIRVDSILKQAEPTVEDGYVLVHAMDGDYACSFLRDRAADALLAVGLDGEELPVEHGGPARLVPTDAESDCWESVKWVTALELTHSAPADEDTAEEIALGRLGQADK
ncbi:molybdopterin-dependent oxidoreductase [Haloarcula japonica]|uniref:Oxidoreductase molybdopterin binding protein n=1 Tax=Haloarcula japonica (strain ATCC 49778 / DSM 6131 / JCM 7785 / NBRC 101032 / NCIMB 13157 / TR-1) TaxID=1227453 RepID=M0L2R0_HALJT|nr:molybdopterin-dependent oxidoreductase [Haloarcula japonica]EMA27821.1 oxidoreductase molybdopterin binding protein [Haloarcula japonica DSM 6131]